MTEGSDTETADQRPELRGIRHSAHRSQTSYIYFEGTGNQTRQSGYAKLYNCTRGATPTREAGSRRHSDPLFLPSAPRWLPPALSSPVYTPLMSVESRLSDDVLLVPSGSCLELRAVNETSPASRQPQLRLSRFAMKPAINAINELPCGRVGCRERSRGGGAARTREFHRSSRKNPTRSSEFAPTDNTASRGFSTSHFERSPSA